MCVGNCLSVCLSVYVCVSICMCVCVKGEQRRSQNRYSPPPGMLPSCDRVAQGVTTSSVGQSMSGSGGGGMFIPVENDVSIIFICTS